MRAGMTEKDAAQAVGRHMERQGYPVRRGGSGADGAANLGLTVMKWRELVDVCQIPNKGRLAAEVKEGISKGAWTPPDLRRELFERLTEQLAALGYTRGK